MSIKSTIELTREQAEEKLTEYLLESFKRMIFMSIGKKSNCEIEKELQEYDEQDDNNFTNYRIIEKEV